MDIAGEVVGVRIGIVLFGLLDIAASVYGFETVPAPSVKLSNGKDALMFVSISTWRAVCLLEQNDKRMG
jgi:hypothetical protein